MSAAGTPDVPAAAPAKTAAQKRVSEAHLKMVDERDGPRGMLEAVREVTSAAIQKVTRNEQAESSRPPVEVEDKQETKRSAAATKKEEVRKMLRTQMLETRSILDNHDEWFGGDLEAGEGGGGAGEVAATPPGPREAPTNNFTPLWGVHFDTRRVRTARIMLVVSYIIIIVCSVLVLYVLFQQPDDAVLIFYTVGAVFVLLAIPFALFNIHMHIVHYVSPLQRHYIRILWMVPVYSMCSWMALRFNEDKLVMETIREFYESYVVYSFLKLMQEFLGPRGVAVAKLAKLGSQRGVNHAKMLFPCGCLPAWRLDSQFLRNTTWGVWQYVFVRMTVSIAVLILEYLHMYHEGSMDIAHFYIWSILIINISQCWALYVLVLFYHELREELKPIRPLGKFLIIKGLVFFAWWQQMITVYLITSHMIPVYKDVSSEDVGRAVQNLLIVVEMLLLAILHRVFFPYTDFAAGGPLSRYLEESRALPLGQRTAMVEMLPVDVLVEGGKYVRKAGKRVRKKYNKVIKARLISNAAMPDDPDSEEEGGAGW